jgi:ferritin-like metal-binding protein YciE
MSDATETIIEYLREAHAFEEATAGMLHGHLRGAPPGPYRSAVRRHLDETRRHAHLIEDRLTDLGASESLLRSGLTVVEGIAGRVAGIALGPLNLIVSRTSADTLLRNAQDAIASEAREVATYEALERLATAAGDDATASLVRGIRADEERALETFRDLLESLADRVVRERIDASAGRGAGAQSASGGDGEDSDDDADDDDIAARAGDADADDADAGDEPDWADDGPQARGPAATEPVARVAPGTRRAHQEPTVRTPSPGQTNGGPVPTDEPSRGEVARMRERMREEEARADEDAVATVGTAEPGAQIRIDAPWEGYDAMTAAQVVARLRDADASTAAVVRLYEQANKGRKSVLAATEDGA